MSILYIKSNGKIGINKKGAFCNFTKNCLPIDSQLIGDLIKKIDQDIHSFKNECPDFNQQEDITREALANSHGDWYEWLLAITALNIYISNGTRYVALLIPNVSTFNVGKIYKEDIQEIILDLKTKVKDSAGVEFVTSNPDFIIINMEGLDVDLGFTKPITVINEDLISKIENLYKLFVDKCSLDDIVGYLSIKTSLRPDRRLQIAHEGSLMKAIYAHIQTRQWNLNPKGIKYYAVSTKIGTADKNALKTVATHSIITVNTLPQAAVDEVYEVNSLDKAKKVFSIILNN